MASQTDIGDSFKAADELRKQHEQLELQCSVSIAPAVFYCATSNVAEVIQTGNVVDPDKAVSSIGASLMSVIALQCNTGIIQLYVLYCVCINLVYFCVYCTTL